MNLIYFLLGAFLYLFSMVLFDFSGNSDLKEWNVVDDVVMGGRSDGHFQLNDAGHAVFEGEVSLENNGGFSSVRYRFPEIEVAGYQKVKIRLRGDGKRYQFRMKSDQSDRHAYITYFQTTGEWQTVEIKLFDMYPTFRGRRLNMPNYSGKKLAEVAFLIGNKKPESFRLELDKIELE